MFSSPVRVGMVHANPHPGNFMVLRDGRLGMVDFGAAAAMPGGSPRCSPGPCATSRTASRS